MKLVLLASVALIVAALPVIPVGAAMDPACVLGPCLPAVPQPPHVDCIQIVPWSYLCSGNVHAFICYYVDDCDVNRGDLFSP